MDIESKLQMSKYVLIAEMALICFLTGCALEQKPLVLYTPPPTSAVPQYQLPMIVPMPMANQCQQTDGGNTAMQLPGIIPLGKSQQELEYEQMVRNVSAAAANEAGRQPLQ